MARWLLVPLLLLILWGALASTWRAPWAVDEQTYTEMIIGISRHGLPYTFNGSPERFPEQEARWNRAHEGRLWGVYPPLFPYLATPSYLLGGLRSVVKFNISLLALLALAVFFLGRRLTGSPLLGTASAYLTVLGTPVAAYAGLTSSFPLVTTAIAWTALLAVASLDAPRSTARLIALATGFVGGLAVGTHLLAAPVVAVLILRLFLPSSDAPDANAPDASQHPTSPSIFLPQRQSLLRGFYALLGASGPLFAVAYLNHLRFGSWNPISYGPCIWKSCSSMHLAKQSLGAIAAFWAPLGVFLIVGGLIAFFLRRRLSLVIGVGVLGLGAVVAIPALRIPLREFGHVGLALLVDVRFVDMRHQLLRYANDGVGVLFGPYVIKAAIQSAPFLGLAFVAPFIPKRRPPGALFSFSLGGALRPRRAPRGSFEAWIPLSSSPIPHSCHAALRHPRCRNDESPLFQERREGRRGPLLPRPSDLVADPT